MTTRRGAPWLYSHHERKTKDTGKHLFRYAKILFYFLLCVFLGCTIKSKTEHSMDECYEGSVCVGGEEVREEERDER